MAFKALAIGAETFVYIYLGMQTALAVVGTPRGTYKWDLPFIAWTIAALFISRALHVFTFVALANRFREVNKRDLFFVLFLFLDNSFIALKSDDNQ